jgi:CHAD domain-containing protein
MNLTLNRKGRGILPRGFRVMAFRFQSNSTVEANVGRILGERLEKGRAALTDRLAEEPTAAIHNARKRLKEARSLLRLIRKSVDQEMYQRQRQSLREIGQRLAPARDGAVYLSTFDQLIDGYSIPLDTHGLVEVRACLQEFQQTAVYEVMGQEEPIAQFTESLTQLVELKLKKKGWKAVGKNLKHLYGQGRERFEIAFATGEDEAFHAWRKRVKDLWYSTQLLQPLWPPVMDVLASETHQLANSLGDDHDLAALRQFLLDHPAAEAISEQSIQVLLPLMKHRQEQLRCQAKEGGCRLYAETPKAFSDRMARYWQVWFSP